MLVLSRKKNESIVINGNIRIEVLQIKGKQIRLGITAPSSMKVLRGELPSRPKSRSETEETGRVATVDRFGRSVASRTSGNREAESAIEKETSIVECDMKSLVASVMASV